MAQFGVDVVGQAAAQHVEIDIAGLHHRGGVLVVDQRQQQMLERRIFVAAFIGEGQRAMEGLFETAGECRHGLFLFHRALQRMLVIAGEIHDLRHLGLRHFECVDSADTHTLLMDVQHDARRLFASLAEKPLKHDARRIPSACSRR